eukprot:m.221481 g.221481  ORF g.221481 m.221481 type:complete len:191 (+) comp19188_c0_seq10:307-879(+)
MLACSLHGLRNALSALMHSWYLGIVTQKCPSLESLEYIHQQKHAPAPNACAHRVIVFWASYADGDFGVLHDVSALCSKPCFESVQPVGISCDSLRDNAESFLPLIGTPVADLKISALSVDIPLAFDVAKSFRSALRATTGLLAVGVSMVFIVDKNDTIVWREQFRYILPQWLWIECTHSALTDASHCYCV